MDREEKERIASLISEKQRRIRTSPRYWALSYNTRPVEFIGELIGPDWYTDKWHYWRVFVKALFGIPIESEEHPILRECTDLDQVEGPYREAWLPIGRRGGKSRILALISLYIALCRDYSKYLSPGEKGYVVVLADRRDHAASIMNYIKAALGHSKLSRLVLKPLVESISLVNNIEIEVVTASIAAVRSRTVIASLCDEIAFWPADETSANPDIEILNGLRPAMATIPNALLLAASSRYARKGELWNNYRDYFGKSEGPLIWSASTDQMNPTISDEFLKSEYERDPIAAASEYGLSWRTDVAAYIEHELIEAVTERGVIELPPRRGVQYHAFVDPSGGAQDSMTLAIAHRDIDIGILDCMIEVRPPFATEEVVEQFSNVMRDYGCFSCHGDKYGGEWPSQQFAKNGIQYEASELTKSGIYREFLPLLTSQRIRLLDNPRLRIQIESLERRVARGGRDSIDHAPGQHDDLANAVAGALVTVVGDERDLVVERFLMGA